MISLDTEQTRAVEAASPTMVNASAGSGKTRCLIAKILRLMEQGISPDNICAITFTNKAANEMKERLKLHCDSIGKMQVSTIHSLCVGIIRNFTRHLPIKPNFSIYDDGDQLSIVKTIIKSRELPGEPKTYVLAISHIKSMGSDNVRKSFRLSQFTSELNEGNFLLVYKTYQEILLKNNACDFDDLLIYANDCLGHKDCADFYSKKWPHLLVDEFQDTSLIQYDIINKLYTKNSKTLFVVADFNQSIYQFRGAHPENIKHFIELHKPTVCHLSFNYRCSPEIIKHANQYIQYGNQMVAKNPFQGSISFTGFNSQEDEAEKISNALIRANDYENTAILFRVNARSLFFERAFASKHIPYKVVGALPYYKRRVPKDLMSFLKASTNRDDLESLNRIVNVPPRGFGAKKKEILLREGWSYLETMAYEMPRIRGLINILNEIKGMTPSEAVETILYKTDYRTTIKKDSDRTMLTSFLEIIREFRTIEDLVLASTFLEEDTGHGVKLLTAHASKGLEFNTVLVVGVEEGVWPHSFAVDKKEEERLFYVACTRAQKCLNISYSKTRTYMGRSVESKPSYLFNNSFRFHKA